MDTRRIYGHRRQSRILACGAMLLVCACTSQQPSPKLVPPPPAQPAVAPQLVQQSAPVRRIDPAEQQAIANYRRTGKEAATSEGDVTRFVYTGKTAKIFCRPLMMTDIELQEGERYIAAIMGDDKLWNPLVIAEAGERVHVSTKPISDTPGIETSLTIYTDKRVYHFLLQSSAKRYMGRVSFYYPDGDEPREMGKEFAR